MTPLVVVALLVGILLGWVWQRTRVAAARLETAMARVETRTWAREATLAWAYADHQEQRADREYDQGWQNGVGILADMGRIEP